MPNSLTQLGYINLSARIRNLISTGCARAAGALEFGVSPNRPNNPHASGHFLSLRHRALCLPGDMSLNPTYSLPADLKYQAEPEH